MKKKIWIAVIAVISLLAMVLAGCSTVKINDVDKDVIGAFRKAIENSEKANTYYVREKIIDGDPKDIAKSEMTEYMLNVSEDDKSIKDVDNTKIEFSIRYTQGITGYTDTYTFGQSLKKGLKEKDAKASDYKLYGFYNYKKNEYAPVSTKKAEQVTKDDIFAFETKTDESKKHLNDYTITSILKDLKELEKDDITDVVGAKKGKVTTYTFKVTKEGHKYAKYDKIKVQIYTDKDVAKIMSVASTDETYTLDTMYQGPKINIANYDTYEASDNVVALTSDRSDGLINLFVRQETEGKEAIVFERTFNINRKVEKDGKTYTYRVTTVESAVNWGYEYTEVVIKLVETDKDGNVISEIDNELGDNETFFVKTSNIVNNDFDITSIIPIAAAVVAVIALLIALMALFKSKKQNKVLANKIKVLSGEVDEEEAEDTAEGCEANEDIKGEETQTEACNQAEQDETNKEDIPTQTDESETEKATSPKAKKSSKKDKTDKE